MSGPGERANGPDGRARGPALPEAQGARPVLAIVGPTAVGKTAVAVAVCQALGGEVVSLDSRQMVRELDAGTAKPTPEERAAAPHHLVDFAAPDAPLSLASVQRLAHAAIEDVRGRGALPVVVGGTGQYVWAVLEGWRVPEVPPNASLRTALATYAAEHGVAALHARLDAVDPASAAAIDARNVRRVIRALEVHAALGVPMSAARGRRVPPWPVAILGLTRPRPALFARIDARIDAMLAAGLETEVRALVARGYGFVLPALSSVGYREWRPYLAGEVDRDAVVKRIRQSTRRLARNQDTWFRRDDPRIRWVDLEAVALEDVVAEAERLVRAIEAAGAAARGP